MLTVRETFMNNLDLSEVQVGSSVQHFIFTSKVSLGMHPKGKAPKSSSPV